MNRPESSHFHLIFAGIDDTFDDEPEEEKDDATIAVGDMELSKTQYQNLYSNDSVKRHGYSDPLAHWPQAMVPVKISENAGFTAEFKEKIMKAMTYISSVSCITFDFEPEDVENFLLIKKGPGCSSEVGYLSKGRQLMKLNPDCGYGNIVHEFLHVLGFLHMHTALNRDDFLIVNFKNIPHQYHNNFVKPTAHVSMYNTQYDFGSIMHYSRYAFALNRRRPTIVPFKDYDLIEKMGQRQGEILKYRLFQI